MRTAPSVCPRGKPTVSDGKSQLCRRGASARGLTRRLRRERWGCRPQGDRTFFRSERKYQRKPAARRLQRRPTSLCTAAKPCAALGLGYALHGFQPFLALVGLRPPLAVGRLPSGAVLEHGVSGVAQLPTGRSARLPPSLRVALGCAQGPTGATLPFGTVRCAHPPGKRLLLPILPAGLAMSRAI